MSIAEGILLGILQGLTEFLPVSSSGHLCLAQSLFGVENPEKYIFFDLFLHLGTLFAVLIVFGKRIKRILVSERIYLLYLFAGLCALLPFLFIVPFLKSFYGQPRYLGFFFIITAMLLFLGDRAKEKSPVGELKAGTRTWHCVLIAISQIIAILPGVSRSGITVSVGRMLGWKPREAAEFSFLIVIPVILAGTLLEGLDLFADTADKIPPLGGGVYVAGFVSAFLVGVIALKLFLTLLERGKFKYFVVYCAVMGVFCLIYFNLLK